MWNQVGTDAGAADTWQGGLGAGKNLRQRCHSLRGTDGKGLEPTPAC